MQIINWSATEKAKLLKSAVFTQDDLVYLGTKVGWEANGAKYLTYAVPVSVIMGGGGSSISLQTNGVVNATQNLLNLNQGSGITLTSDPAGGVTIEATSVSPTQVIMLDVDATFVTGKVQSLGILSFSTIAFKSYSFRATISYTVSNNLTVATDWGASWDGSSGDITQQGYYTQLWDADNGLVTIPSRSVYDPLTEGSLGQNTYSSTRNIAVVEGIITNTKVVGTITITGIGGILGGGPGGSVTVYAGSTLVVNELP